MPSKEKSSQFEQLPEKQPSELQPVWNGVLKEYYNYRTKSLGKILTIIDAVIVDEKQNKSVKDLINNVLWDTTDTEINIAHWFKWLDDNYFLQGQENDSSEPMKYNGIPAGDFRNY